MQVKITDSASPWLQWVVDNKPDWMRKALKSTGNFARQEIKSGIKSGAPAGKVYAAIMDRNRSRDLMAARRVGAQTGPTTARGKRHAARRKAPILGKLGAWIRYQYGNGRVTVGWLAQWAVLFGSRMELGESEAVTKKIRGLYGGAAEGLKRSTTTIKVPARPTIGPMYSYLQPLVRTHFAGKLLYYMENGGPPAKTSRNKG